MFARTLFIAAQSLQGVYMQLGITVNSSLSRRRCFILVIQSQMRWLQGSRCSQDEGYAVLRNREWGCVGSLHVNVCMCTKNAARGGVCVNAAQQRTSKHIMDLLHRIYVCILSSPPMEISRACRGVNVPNCCCADRTHCSVTWI